MESLAEDRPRAVGVRAPEAAGADGQDDDEGNAVWGDRDGVEGDRESVEVEVGPVHDRVAPGR